MQAISPQGNNASVKQNDIDNGYIGTINIKQKTRQNTDNPPYIKSCPSVTLRPDAITTHGNNSNVHLTNMDAIQHEATVSSGQHHSSSGTSLITPVQALL